MTDSRRTDDPQDHDQDAPIVDHPFLRESPTCPTCNNRKDRGLLVCWTCYRALDLRNQLRPAIASILHEAEREAAGQHISAAAQPPTAVYEEDGSGAHVYWCPCPRCQPASVTPQQEDSALRMANTIAAVCYGPKGEHRS
jgi:hypothetical protein